VLATLGLALHRAALRTERPLRPLWRLAHTALIRGAVAHLLRGRRGSGAYVRASFGYGDQLHGLSDVDLLVVLGDDARAGHACPRVRRRWRRLCRRVPGLEHVVQPTVYEARELRAAVSAPTLTAAGAVHLAPEPACDEAGLRLRPGLFGPMRDWRHVAGRDHRPAELPVQGEHERRLAAWLELQRWWREAFHACAHPAGPRLAHLCVKLVAEPARIWLWLVHGEAVRRRRDVLELALRRVPDEREAIARALALYDALPRSPAAPLAEMLPAFVRLSARIGREVVRQVETADVTAVRLAGTGEAGVDGPAGELALGPDAAARLRALGAGEPRLLPLADWRSRVWPALPDEALAPLALDPTDPDALGAAALAAGDWGPFAALRADGLLILPGPGLVRAVQCQPTDPVSFALLEGAGVADFPDVPGWSARDAARRAVAEHVAWLGAGGTLARLIESQPRTTVPALDVLGRLLTAAQGALFHESLAAGEPELPLTMAAVAARLADRGAGAATEAHAVYAAARRAGEATVPARVVAALREAVLELPAYTPRTGAPLRA
jgi:hypothetical protein